MARGGIENKRLLDATHTIAHFVNTHEDAFEKEEEKTAFSYLLEELQKKYSPEEPTLFLAKGQLQGQLQGHSAPLWRSPGALLRGVGFQYDFADNHGPARELRSGAPAGQVQAPGVALMQVDDLLVTSGLDGVFPEGLQIARVHSIAPLREGAIAYEILATPTAEDVLDLHVVFVLPPQPSREELSRVDMVREAITAIVE